MGKILLPKGFNLAATRHWYLVASRAGAKVYAGRPDKQLVFLKNWSNPRGKRLEHEIGPDRPGRNFSSGRHSGLRHAYESRLSQHELAAIRFAKRLARALERDLLEDKYTGLVILAEPHFLGLLNKALSPRVKNAILKSIPREWGQGSDESLARFLKKKVA